MTLWQLKLVRLWGNKMELLTHSRMQSFKLCRKQHHYAYELCLRRTEDARALRMGSAFHDGIEELGKGNGIEAACASVSTHYATRPEFADELDWDYERETLLRLVCAYDWHWASSGIVNLATELPFEIPLTNPQTGRPTPNFNLAGKIDAIVRLEDGRIAVKETKTKSEDISIDSQLWRRLRMDHQISLYLYAARKLGYQVDTVLYDVARKPTIAPNPVPLVDDNGIKIVHDLEGNRVRNANGKTWRQTGDSDKGYFVQSRAMSPEEWGQKLTEDICNRPGYYFARVEIPRLDSDVSEFLAEVWDIQQQVRQAQRESLWYRSVGNHCQFCTYFEQCSTNQLIDLRFPPQGFEVVKNRHPELEVAKNVSDSSNTACTAESSACTAAAADA